MGLEAIIIDILTAICKGFALPIAEDLFSGKLTRPTPTLVEAQADPEDVNRALDYVAQYEKDHS